MRARRAKHSSEAEYSILFAVVLASPNFLPKQSVEGTGADQMDSRSPPKQSFRATKQGIRAECSRGFLSQADIENQLGRCADLEICPCMKSRSHSCPCRCRCKLLRKRHSKAEYSSNSKAEHSSRVFKRLSKAEYSSNSEAEYSSHSKAEYSRHSKAEYSRCFQTKVFECNRTSSKPQYSRTSFCFGFFCFGI